MLQPILFQSRAVDLSVLVDYLDEHVLHSMVGPLSSTDAHLLHLYVRYATGEYLDHLQQIMYNEFQIDLKSLEYRQFPVPVALDCETGETFVIRSVDYSPSRQAIMNVLVEDGADLRYIYNKDVYAPEGRYCATLKILNDGWV